MNRLRKALDLSWPDRILVLKVWGTLAAMRAAILILPFERFRRVTAALGRSSAARPDRPTPEKVGWAIMAASGFVPGGQNCLLRAVTAEVLLRRLGYESKLEIGGRKTRDGRFEAHAWLVSGNRIIVGGAEKDAYMAMTRERDDAQV